MQRWEYIKVRTGNNRVIHINDEYVDKQKIDASYYLNKLGDEGWEMVGYQLQLDKYDIFVLKRPKE